MSEDKTETDDIRKPYLKEKDHSKEVQFSEVETLAAENTSLIEEIDGKSEQQMINIVVSGIRNVLLSGERRIDVHTDPESDKNRIYRQRTSEVTLIANIGMNNNLKEKDGPFIMLGSKHNRYKLIEKAYGLLTPDEQERAGAVLVFLRNIEENIDHEKDHFNTAIKLKWGACYTIELSRDALGFLEITPGVFIFPKKDISDEEYYQQRKLIVDSPKHLSAGDQIESII